MTVTLPYGSWPTPITSELVVKAARTPSSVHVDGGDLWWSEARPEEGGRQAVLRRTPEGTVTEVLAAPWNARTAVHEYGGGAWWVHGSVLFFADWATQRLHRLAPGNDAEALTPEPEVARGLRYADGDVHPDGGSMLCVQEEHHTDGAQATNTIVLLDAHAPSRPEVVVRGPDFVSNPRWRSDGGAFCWLEWDHPDMPWDATRLVVDVSGVRTVVAGGDRRESICQPTWAPDGTLWFSSDRSGFWSLHRWSADGDVEVMVDLGKDIGFPQWVFGLTCFALLDDGATVFVVNDGGVQRLAHREPHFGRVSTIDVPHTSIGQLRSMDDGVVYIGASAATEPHVVRLPASASGSGPHTVAVPPRELSIDESWFAAPEPIEFPTAGGSTAHALLYRPTNPEVVGPPDDRPPLIVEIHGGPTSAARPMLQLGIQYWTSRGFAVVDVNYRGSSGYGRAYRDLLQGQWGIADVEDCVAVCRFLADRGDVDPERMCITGGSAGGFTVLTALTSSDVFAAGANHFGVADLAALARDTHKFESRYLDGLVAPWPEGKAVYDERSPINHVDGIDCPLVVFQGLEDAVVPPNQSEMIVDAVRAKGVPVAYVAFEGEQHGFRQAANIRAALDGELSFYAQVLGFDLPPDEGIEPIAVENLPPS